MTIRDQDNRRASWHRIALAESNSVPRWLILPLAFLLALLLIFVPRLDTSADPLTPEREQLVTVEEAAYTWWLTDWQNNEVLCELSVYHQGLPTRLEILEACGHDHYQRWLTTPECSSDSCRGSYLHFVKSKTVTREISIQLPTAAAYLSLESCAPSSDDYVCHGQPKLMITAEEPLPNESILSIQGTFAGLSFSCASSSCEVPLRPTPAGGSRLAFWANSSFGDSSEAYTAKVRVTVAGGDEWHVSVLSKQLREPRPPSCALEWQSLPPAAGLPPWLENSDQVEQLATSKSYVHLAEQLLYWGLVPTDECPNLGFDESGALNACALESARPVVTEWQNRFDLEIFSVANERNVPARLLKNLFAKESQFWPGVYLDNAKEVGLGQLTEIGADTTLLWNPSFFQEFCPLVLSRSSCDQGYAGLLPGEQELLRGALFREADASCADCTEGIDLRQADASVRVFAETLLAHCGQVGRLIRNVAEASPGDVSSYPDLWKFTVASYHGGPGCLSTAFEKVWKRNQSLHWEAVANNLDPGCQSIPGYVDEVTADPLE